MDEFIQANKGNTAGGTYFNNCITSSQEILKNGHVGVPREGAFNVRYPNNWARTLYDEGIPGQLLPGASKAASDALPHLPQPFPFPGMFPWPNVPTRWIK